LWGNNAIFGGVCVSSVLAVSVAQKGGALHCFSLSPSVSALEVGGKQMMQIWSAWDELSRAERPSH